MLLVTQSQKGSGVNQGLLLRANPYLQPLKVWQYALFCIEMLPPVIEQSRAQGRGSIIVLLENNYNSKFCFFLNVFAFD
jgi:hypothetical protein